MTKIFLFGISGRMGRTVVAEAAAHECEVVGGFDAVPHPALPTVSDVSKADMPFDVVVDFSRPETLDQVISLCKMRKAPTVMAATGYDAAQLAKINELAALVPVLKSGNMSLGVCLMTRLVKKAAAELAGCDIEIVEKHHNMKADAPSGTAKQLFEAVASVRSGLKPVYGREGAAKRAPEEVGIHAVRGGSVVGEHEVMFMGADEVITVSHSAGSRSIFAHGALTAAKFLIGKAPGLYDIENLFANT